MTSTGGGNTNGTGNALANVLKTRNTGNNTLDGGTGADQMAGGLGNDTGSRQCRRRGERVSVGKASTLVQKVQVELFSLVGQDIENSDPGGLRRPSTAPAMRWSMCSVGNAGANLLDGGAGADQMAGRRGNDTYIVDNAGDTVEELRTTRAPTSYRVP